MLLGFLSKIYGLVDRCRWWAIPARPLSIVKLLKLSGHSGVRTHLDVLTGDARRFSEQEQLLLHVGFMETVKLHSIDFVAPADGETRFKLACSPSTGLLFAQQLTFFKAFARVSKRGGILRLASRRPTIQPSCEVSS